MEEATCEYGPLVTNFCFNCHQLKKHHAWQDEIGYCLFEPTVYRDSTMDEYYMYMVGMPRAEWLEFSRMKKKPAGK